jgi:hypothetical protein
VRSRWRTAFQLCPVDFDEDAWRIPPAPKATPSPSQQPQAVDPDDRDRGPRGCCCGNSRSRTDLAVFIVGLERSDFVRLGTPPTDEVGPLEADDEDGKIGPTSTVSAAAASRKSSDGDRMPMRKSPNEVGCQPDR